jgi:hypothetical protein
MRRRTLLVVLAVLAVVVAAGAVVRCLAHRKLRERTLTASGEG